MTEFDEVAQAIYDANPDWHSPSIQHVEHLVRREMAFGEEDWIVREVTESLFRLYEAAHRARIAA